MQVMFGKTLDHLPGESKGQIWPKSEPFVKYLWNEMPEFFVFFRMKLDNNKAL